MLHRSNLNCKPLILAALLLIVSWSVNAQKTNTENLKKSGYASVNGLQMYYETYRSGNTPLVLIHGGGSIIKSSFGNMLPLLSGYGKIIAVELQAHLKY